MTPSVRKVIREYFPEESESEIQAILAPFGQGPGHARTAHAHVRMIYLSNGDMEELKHIVAQAVAAPDDFGAGWICYESWERVVESFTNRARGSFFADVARRLRRPAVELQVRCMLSADTVCLYGPNVEDSLEAGLYFLPLADGRVYVTREHTCIFAPKTDEVAELCAGEMIGGPRLTDALADHLVRVFGNGETSGT